MVSGGSRAAGENHRAAPEKDPERIRMFREVQEVQSGGHHQVAASMA